MIFLSYYLRLTSSTSAKTKLELENMFHSLNALLFKENEWIDVFIGRADVFPLKYI